MSSETEPAVELSPIEELQFGVRTARVGDLSGTSLSEVLEFCRSERVELLIARCSTDRIHDLQELERGGFLLMDTLITWGCPLPFEQRDVGFRGEVRSAEPTDWQVIERIARDSFRTFSGHYHADLRLARDRVNEAYADWARRACAGEASDEMLVAMKGSSVIGFMAFRSVGSDLESRLSAVSAEARGEKAFSAMIEEVRRRGGDRPSRMIVPTHIGNLPVQKALCSLGFAPLASHHTFHKWFDEPTPG